MPQLEVCLSPDLISKHILSDKTVVVIDIFRATSCMTTALSHGIAAIIPTASVEDCKALQTQGYIAAAEREGLKVTGFDLDNSPFSYMDPNLKGKTIAMTTTNGTQAIGLSKDARNIIIGSFLNLNTVVKYLKETSNDTVLICSGWKGNPCIEDTLYAGAVVFNLSDSFAISQDSAIIASELYKNNKDKKMALVENASHVKRLARLNIIKDIEFCLQESIYNVLPIYINGKLKNLIQ